MNGPVTTALCVLGPLEVERDGEPVRLGSGQQRRLLAVLLTRANQVVSSDQLVDVLWGDDSSADAALSPQTLVARLQTLVSRLRATLGDDRLETRPPGYVLRVATNELDALRFEELVRLGLESSDRADVARRAFDDAIALWRGPPYAEFANEEFASAEVARLGELRFRAIEERAAALLELGHPGDVIGQLEAEIAIEPFRERLRALLMLALARAGRPVESLRAFDDFRRFLADEVGVVPSPGLQELNDDILRQHPDIGWSASSRHEANLTLPTGTVTFLFTDLEGSTRLWQEQSIAMHDALARHDEILRHAIESSGGHVVKTTGDGTHGVFAAARNALQAAVEAQRTITTEEWGPTGPLRVRIGLHTGEAEHRGGDYYGTAVNRAARLMSVANGGQVLVSNATEQVLRDDLSSEFRLVDLGEHRLRDLSNPERVFQLEAPGLPNQFGPLDTLDTFPTNLPLQVTSFVGRDEELSAVSGLLEESRLVTLTGVGGVGKTRLALQVAAEVLPQFPDGAWVCELAAAHDADSLAQVVAAALGAVPRAGASLEGSVREFLRVKRLLLVLDNCEHLLDAGGRFADAVLRDCRGVRILATSREGLGIAGEQVWSLRSLALPGSASAVEVIAASHAVRLFAERARAVRSAFTLDDVNASAVADICRRLDGIPLAIELAAARVVAMSPTDIGRRLDERFRLLTGGRRTAVERHQTLRATVDWSYELLDPTERITFNRLGVFAGSFDATAAEAVAADDGIEGWDVLDALTSLVAKSMIVAEEHADATTRYQMLETMRYYALERLDDPDHWRRRHAGHYAEFAEEAGRAVIGPDEVLWRRRIRSELDNLRAGVNWALGRDASDDVLAVRIIAALARESYLDRSSGIGAWAERALPRLTQVPPGLRTAVLAAAAHAALGRDELETARSLALEAVEEGFPDDCPAPLCAHTALAMTHAYGLRVDLALQVIENATDAVNAAGADLYGRSALQARAAILHTWNNDPGARAEAEEAVRLARQLGNPSALSDALYVFSWAFWTAQPDAALAALDECIELTRAGASEGVFDGALTQAARLRADRDEREAALELLREAIVHSHQTGYRRGALFALSNTVEVLMQLGRPEPAAVLSGWDPSRIARVPPHRALRAALDAETYERARARGDAMTFDGVVAFALTTIDELLAEARASSTN